MIHNLWISKKTGECLLNRRYGEIKQEENLITSFLSAIEIFALNVDTGCQKLETDSYKFLFASDELVVSVICIDKKHDEQAIRKDLIKIQKEFLTRFQKTIEDWDGNVHRYKILRNYIDDILQKHMSHINLSQTKLELNHMIVKERPNMKLSPQQSKLISLLKYKGTATLGDIVKYMRLNQDDAEIAAKDLIHQNIIRTYISPQ